MRNPKKQVYFSNAIDKELLEFIDKQSNLSKTLTLGMQILYEIFGNKDLKEILPMGFEAHDTPVTYEKLLKKVDQLNHQTSVPVLNNELELKEMKPNPNSVNIKDGQVENDTAQILNNVNPEVLQALQQLINLNQNNIPITNGGLVNNNSSVNQILPKEEKIEQSDIPKPSPTPVSEPKGPTSNTVENKGTNENKSNSVEGSWEGLEDFDI